MFRLRASESVHDTNALRNMKLRIKHLAFFTGAQKEEYVLRLVVLRVDDVNRMVFDEIII